MFPVQLTILSMGRRDVAIILVFLMLAIGSGLPQALHLKVDHGCCGAACAIAINSAGHGAARHGCCPHHNHTHTAQEQSDQSQSSDLLHAVTVESADSSHGAAVGEHPFSQPHDCSVCQFLATLTATVALDVVVPVEFTAGVRSPAVPVSHVPGIEVTSQGPRAPPVVA